MRKNVMIFLVVAMTLIYLPESYALVFYPMGDAPTSSANPSTNYNCYNNGLVDELWTGSFSDVGNTRSYLQFNLMGLYYIDTAILYLYNGLDSGGRSSFNYAPVDAYSTSSSVWSEDAITWAINPGLDVLETTTGVGSAIGWYTWNVTSLAQSKANGILSLGLSSSGAGHAYYGRESPYPYMPYLLVNCVPEPATILSFGSFVLMFLPGIRRKISR